MYVGEIGVRLKMPLNNPNVGAGWTFVVKIGMVGATASPGVYTATLSGDSTYAYYDTAGSEFAAGPGMYNIDLDATGPSGQLLKSRAVQRVDDAY